MDFHNTPHIFALVIILSVRNYTLFSELKNCKRQVFWKVNLPRVSTIVLLFQCLISQTFVMGLVMKYTFWEQLMLALASLNLNMQLSFLQSYTWLFLLATAAGTYMGNWLYNIISLMYINLSFLINNQSMVKAKFFYFYCYTRSQELCNL